MLPAFRRLRHREPPALADDARGASQRHLSRSCRAARRHAALSRRRVARQLTESHRRLEALRDEVLALQRRRDLAQSAKLNARMHAATLALDATRHFYELFACGYDPARRPELSRRAEQFLRSVMAEDVVCTEFRGVDTFLQQYEVSSTTHASMQVTLKSLSVVHDEADSISIKAEAIACFRIKRETLQRFFPTIILDEPLAQRLIGKAYELTYDKVFHFRADGRIFQHESRVDFCSSLLQLVGDPFLALQLLQASLMTKHGHWKVNSLVQEDRHALVNPLLD
ncbi:hypothetical protein ATCC90586_004449 [Pythium insidiosum]|nr:hypothetical protein ATCC90586_004449 [Pythium insidiosum]